MGDIRDRRHEGYRVFGHQFRRDQRAFPYVTVLPVLSRAEGRDVYPFEAALGVSDRSDESSVALIHHIRALKAEHLTDRRGMVQDEDARTAVKEAMAAHFGF